MAKLGGLWVPVATPFEAAGEVDYATLVRHSAAVLAEGATGVAVLGTTGEANSLTVAERLRVIDAHLEAGVAADQLLPGTGSCAIGDVIELASHAADVGVLAVLLL